MCVREREGKERKKEWGGGERASERKRETQRQRET